LKDLQEDKRFKRELTRLRRIFTDISKNKKALVDKLIWNAAFQATLLEDLKIDLDTNGYKEEYQNGQYQTGVKKSVAADLYQNTLKNYSGIIKQLTDLLPKDAPKVEDDGFDAFVNGREDIG